MSRKKMSINKSLNEMVLFVYFSFQDLELEYKIKFSLQEEEVCDPSLADTINSCTSNLICHQYGLGSHGLLLRRWRQNTFRQLNCLNAQKLTY